MCLIWTEHYFNTVSVGVVALQRAITHCINEFNIEINMPTNEHIRNSFGLASNLFYKKLISPWSKLTEDLVHQESLKQQRELLAEGYGDLFPLVGEMLRYINNKGCRIYIASNGSKEYLEMIEDSALKKYKIEKWFSCNETSVTKACVLCSLLNDSQNNIIAMVGDRKEECFIRKHSRSKFIWCEYGYENKNISPDMYHIMVHNSTELFKVIMR